jgi:hypothetical protein
MESTEENLTQYGNYVNARKLMQIELNQDGTFPDLLLTLAAVKTLQAETEQLKAVLWEIRNGLNQHDKSHNNGDGMKTVGLARIRHALNSVRIY